MGVKWSPLAFVVTLVITKAAVATNNKALMVVKKEGNVSSSTRSPMKESLEFSGFSDHISSPLQLSVTPY